MTLIIGNILALIASLIMVYAGTLVTKKKILYAQSIQIGLFVISNIVLGGITGALINAISFFRNIICYKEKLNLKWKIIITFISFVLSICFNNMGIIGYLPLISTIAYLWLMTIKDITKFKLLIIFTIIMWGFYDFTIKSYISLVFDVMNIIVNIYSIYKINNHYKSK